MTKKKNAFVFDSCSGVKNGEYENVYIMPLILTKITDGKVVEYKDGVDIEIDKLLVDMVKGEKYKTSQINIGSFIDLIEKLQESYENIYIFPIPSGLSNTYFTIKNFLDNEKETYHNVHVFDQTMVAHLLKWTILDLLDADSKGLITKEYIEEYIRISNKNKLAFLVVPDPKYLVAGGRVSNFKGAILKLFKLKLVLSLSANALKYYDKVVKLEKIPEVLIKGAKELAPSFSFEKIKRECILYSPQITDPEFDIEKIKNIVVKGFCGQVPNVTPEYDQLTPIIAVHTGPNYFVIGFELK